MKESNVTLWKLPDAHKHMIYCVYDNLAFLYLKSLKYPRCYKQYLNYLGSK